MCTFSGRQLLDVLGSIPRELRDSIYDVLVCEQQQPAQVSVYAVGSMTGGLAPSGSASVIVGPNIGYTCKTIATEYAEAVSRNIDVTRERLRTVY